MTWKTRYQQEADEISRFPRHRPRKLFHLLLGGFIWFSLLFAVVGALLFL